MDTWNLHVTTVIRVEDIFPALPTMSSLTPFRSSLRVVAGALLGLTFWLSLASAADKTAADYYVHSLPGAPDGDSIKMHAG